MTVHDVSGDLADGQAKCAFRSAAHRTDYAALTGCRVLREIQRSAVRRTVHAQHELFADGDPARWYYLVDDGRLLASRRRKAGKLAIRFLTSDDLFILDCNGTHAASCHAVVDSVVLVIERGRLDRLSRRDPALARVLANAHANDLEMILETLSPGPATADLEQPIEVGAADCSDTKTPKQPRSSRQRVSGL